MDSRMDGSLALAGVWRGKLQQPSVSWTEEQAGQMDILIVRRESTSFPPGGERSSRVAGQP